MISISITRISVHPIRTVIIVNSVAFVVFLARAIVFHPLFQPASVATFNDTRSLFSMTLSVMIGTSFFLLPLILLNLLAKKRVREHNKRVSLKFAILCGGLMLIPFLLYSAELIRFTALATNCDACGDAGLLLIFVLPATFVLMIVAMAVGYFFARWRLR